MVIPTLKVGQLNVREAKPVTQGHTASKEKSRLNETGVEGRAGKQKGR